MNTFMLLGLGILDYVVLTLAGMIVAVLCISARIRMRHYDFSGRMKQFEETGERPQFHGFNEAEQQIIEREIEQELQDFFFVHHPWASVLLMPIALVVWLLRKDTRD